MFVVSSIPLRIYISSNTALISVANLWTSASHILMGWQATGKRPSWALGGRSRAHDSAFSSGFQGHHRLLPGARCSLEKTDRRYFTDILIPFSACSDTHQGCQSVGAGSRSKRSHTLNLHNFIDQQFACYFINIMSLFRLAGVAQWFECWPAN